MSEFQQVSRRRRQKILSRSSEQTSQGDDQVSSQPSTNKSDVFDRYKLLKQKEENERKIINMSRYAGLIIFPLSYYIPPWLAFTLVALAFVVGVVKITGGLQEGNNGLTWLNKIPFIGNLRHLNMIIDIVKVTANSLLSFVMTTVLLNAIYILAQQHLLEQVSLEPTSVEL